MPEWLSSGYTFPVSGVTVNPLLPFLVGLVVSFFTSMGGVSGAFLLLPFQVSVLGFTSPSVSSTNLVFNLVAIPSGIYRFIREKRMNWSLAWVIVAGTMPGVFLGEWIRPESLPDPGMFKAFVGVVLLYIGGRLLWDVVKDLGGGRKKKAVGVVAPGGAGGTAGRSTGEGEVRTTGFTVTRVTYSWQGNTYAFNPLWVTLLVMVVGVIGGTYGIGGGAIIAPFLVSVFGLPVHTIAGAALTGTFITSIVGVVVYTVLEPVFGKAGGAIAPDWLLGALFGAGGMIGIYVGARLQKRMPATAIKAMLSAIMLFLAVKYVLQFLS